MEAKWGGPGFARAGTTRQASEARSEPQARWDERASLLHGVP